jgi:hypothetical protein
MNGYCLPVDIISGSAGATQEIINSCWKNDTTGRFRIAFHPSGGIQADESERGKNADTTNQAS